MKLIVKQDTCIGCGGCVGICDKVFEFNDDGLAHVIKNPIPPEYVESASEALEYCPVSAIQEEE